MQHASPPQTRVQPAPSASLGPQDQAAIDGLLAFWFEGQNPQDKWFKASDAFDAKIRGQYGDSVEKARQGALDHWQQTPAGTVALLLLLDQFPRNLYRGSGQSFASDARALEVVIRAIAKGFDRKVPPLQQVFFYLPLEHDETLVSQVACVALTEILRGQADEAFVPLAELFYQFALRHRDTILQFGRFPGRNAALKRPSTPEEQAYLADHPMGF
jgi:uncharacterized protein (DUF924 family)